MLKCVITHVENEKKYQKKTWVSSTLSDSGLNTRIFRRVQKENVSCRLLLNKWVNECGLQTNFLNGKEHHIDRNKKRTEIGSADDWLMFYCIHIQDNIIVHRIVSCFIFVRRPYIIHFRYSNSFNGWICVFLRIYSS